MGHYLGGSELAPLSDERSERGGLEQPPPADPQRRKLTGSHKPIQHRLRDTAEDRSRLGDVKERFQLSLLEDRLTL